ncbi:putative hydrolase rbbp9 [Rhizophlyctis rosea]|uniref:Hydrolase rbbp9 n=1 Tax=Rhizophlyctis rosea TaxID=64517 RepID=A0AAD5X0B2_9FUNG|nr:putative hydrolase rbbp9 [Rhizophlyctis rosea]
MTSSNLLKVILIPGNGVSNIHSCLWYPWLEKTINTRLKTQIPGGLKLTQFPDPDIAHENIWIPFVLNDLKADENTIVVGHSSGSAAAMRLAESHRVHSLFLLSAYHSDLGDETERESGYFGRPWQWDKIKANTKFIVQMSSEDDPLVPIEEQRFVARELGLEGTEEYVEFKDMGHFTGIDMLPELVEQIERKLKE